MNEHNDFEKLNNKNEKTPDEAAPTTAEQGDTPIEAEFNDDEPVTTDDIGVNLNCNSPTEGNGNDNADDVTADTQHSGNAENDIPLSEREATYTPEFGQSDFAKKYNVTEQAGQSFGYNSSSISTPELKFSEPRPEKVKNRGLRVFCAALTLVLIVAISASAGYIASEKNSSAGSVKVPDTSLASRPDKDSELSENYSAAAEKVKKSVVSILVYGSSQISNESSASGVVYSKDGYIVTNDHIYEGIKNAKFMVRLYNGKEYKASYVAGDTRSDLAVIKLDDKSVTLDEAVFGNSDQAVVGESVIALGYPSNYGDDFTLTHGIISAVNRRVSSTTTNYASSFLQTDATLNPGSSGGALCNMYGQIIGITSSKLSGSNYEAVSYAIPTTTMKRVVESLIKDKCVSDRAKLGITYKAIDSVSAEQANLPVGVYVDTISSDSDLYGKGFEKGDVITHVGDKQITSSDVLLTVIENSKAGDTIRLTIYKTKKKTSKTVSVKLIADKGISSYNNSNSSDSNGIFDVQPSNPDENSSSSSSSDNSSKTFDFPLN